MAFDRLETPASSHYPAGPEDPPDRTIGVGRGRAAGWVLYGSFLAFDVIFALAALSGPAWWRWAMLVVLVVAQVACFRLAPFPPALRRPL